jgi:hypothetical protein
VENLLSPLFCRHMVPWGATTYFQELRGCRRQGNRLRPSRDSGLPANIQLIVSSAVSGTLHAAGDAARMVRSVRVHLAPAAVLRLRRLRSVIWKQWNRGRVRFGKLCAREINKDLTAKTPGSAHGPWHLANSRALHDALPLAYFDSLGLPRLFAGS